MIIKSKMSIEIIENEPGFHKKYIIDQYFFVKYLLFNHNIVPYKRVYIYRLLPTKKTSFQSNKI
jgi:hypothetical protein